MKNYAVHVLTLVLAQAKRDRATEIRFVSGMCPALVDKSGPHFVDVAYLSQEVVRNLHQECLSLAGESKLLSRATASYMVSVPKLGRFLCKYHLRDNIASLTLQPDADATEAIEAIRPIKSPSLRAEARPEESAPRNRKKH